jgi:hypothetical protein
VTDDTVLGYEIGFLSSAPAFREYALGTGGEGRFPQLFMVGLMYDAGMITVTAKFFFTHSWRASLFNPVFRREKRSCQPLLFGSTALLFLRTLYKFYRRG